MAKHLRSAPKADISLAVIHKLAKKPAPARHSSSNSKLVNNCAAGKNCGGGRPASARSQSPRSNRKTVSERLLGEPKALASTSNRKTPQEGHHISLVDSRAKRRKNQRQQKPMNESEQWKQYRAFGAVDWASAKHSVVIVDQAGRVVEDFEIEHSALGWKKFREKLQSYGSIPFAIETSRGAAVEQLLEAGMIVYPLNPKSAQAYRERKAPSGVKDDRLDAWSFADALRIDGQDWKALRPEEPLIKELRLLCRDEVNLIEQRTALINQLRHALAEYYPAALEAFEDWTSVSAWMFLQRFPTPELLAQAGKRQWQKFLHTRRLWGSDQGPRRMEIFAHATELQGSVPTANAKSLLALSLVQMLFVIEKQLAVYRQRIEELFARHPDHDLFGSLPPVTRRSGKYRHCHPRWACDKYLRHAIHLFADQSLSRCAWAQIYYQHHRQKDRGHSDALRRLGHRWLKIIYKMWTDRTPYDPELHQRNQLQHGSWILQLKKCE
jgi:transposase